MKGTDDGSSVGPNVGLSSRTSSKQSKVGSGPTEPYASSHPTGGMLIRWGATAVYRWIIASRASRVGVPSSPSTPEGGPTGLAKRTLLGPIGSAAWPGAGSDSAASLNGSTGGAKASGLVEDDRATSSSGPPVLMGLDSLSACRPLRPVRPSSGSGFPHSSRPAGQCLKRSRWGCGRPGARAFLVTLFYGRAKLGRLPSRGRAVGHLSVEEANGPNWAPGATSRYRSRTLGRRHQNATNLWRRAGSPTSVRTHFRKYRARRHAVVALGANRR